MLALDVDTMPGLAGAIGITRSGGRLPPGLAERTDRGWRMKRPGTGPVTLVERFAERGPDGIRYLELGKLPGQVEPTVTTAFRHVMEGFRRPGWAVVADLAAGTRQPMFRWARFASVVVVVADSSAKSLITARRLAPLATHLVANKVRSPADVESVRSAVALPLLGTVPYDGSVVAADRRGVALIDFDSSSPAVGAAVELTDRLQDLSTR